MKAKLKYLRMSPRKIRLAADLIRGNDVASAERKLLFAKIRPSRPIAKLLKSAISNAVKDYKKDKTELYVKEIRVDEGPTLKRFMPRAFGRATSINKRTSHVSIVLGEKGDLKNKRKSK